MDDLLRIIGRIFYYMFIWIIMDLIFDSIFNRKRKRNYNSYDQQQGHQTFNDDTFGGNQNSQGSYERNSEDYSSYRNSTSIVDEAYSVFGLTKSATDTEIKKKYRILAKKYHPDRNPSIEAQAEMTKINNAYETIMESRKH
ncbi:J domain-containing protein [Spiroplasma culicicola]|uniref:J domain-containing protein n=1 Tax=Spiroplasma culicicola AES-1 TaxID=1276246 RepID=W6A7X6_9MOLU|nr:J domain-containing protein [Spiroplasma culicicola]AHI53218.1 hypothetical protein SCULI_v1c08780 [Spiroplasma culicicola AES-1]